MTKKSYYVYLNLNHDGRAYERGSQVSLPEDMAERLMADGVIGTEKVLAPVEAPASEAPQEPVAEPAVGGAPVSSGEPSIDGQGADSAPTEAVDVTPVVSERMTRAELEEVAAKEGVAKEAVETADTKASLVDLITANRNPSTEPAPAESEAVDASADL